MQRLELAVAGLEQALTCSPPAQRSWRHLVRQRIASVGDALTAEVMVDECAVAARASRLHRERTRLLDRLGALGTRLTESVPEDSLQDESLREHLVRLSHDIAHHHQRVTDLVYDADGRDVGGSE
jgi:hypothetical protein